MKSITTDNPCGLNGFAFIEFSGPDRKRLQQQFTDLGFQHKATHISEDIDWYQQGHIQFIINAAPNCQAETHAKTHGPGACAMGFLVENAQQAFAHAVQQGATPFHDAPQTHGALDATTNSSHNR
jgi:4-hydroxyphenylpyruvate dioxygenase